MDIKSFFSSIDQEILYGLISAKIKNKEIIWLSKKIIFHDSARSVKPIIQSSPSLFRKLPPEKSLFKVRVGKGLPIGNLTSQFFANVYLNELDLFVKHILKAKHYLRYVDDFLILSFDRNYLRFCQKEISEFLVNKLKLRAHPKKQFIRPVSSGIDFVGYIVRSEYVLARRRVVQNIRKRIEAIEAESTRERCIVQKEILIIYDAFLKWANCRGLVATLKISY